MKTLRKLSGIIAAASLLVVMTACVTATTIGGTADRHGLLSGYGAAANVNGGRTELASYTIILGLFDAGHADYAAKVKAAKTKGKVVTTKTMWFLFATKTTAYSN